MRCFNLVSYRSDRFLGLARLTAGVSSLHPLEQDLQLIGNLGRCLRRSEVPDIVKQAQTGIWNA